MADCLGSGRTWPELICLQKVTLSGQTGIHSEQIWSRKSLTTLRRSCYECGTAICIQLFFEEEKTGKRRKWLEPLWMWLGLLWMQIKQIPLAIHQVGLGHRGMPDTHRSGVKCSQQHAASIIGMFSKLKSLRQKKLLSKFSFTGENRWHFSWLWQEKKKRDWGALL